MMEREENEKRRERERGVLLTNCRVLERKLRAEKDVVLERMDACHRELKGGEQDFYDKVHRLDRVGRLCGGRCGVSIFFDIFFDNNISYEYYFCFLIFATCSSALLLFCSSALLGNQRCCQRNCGSGTDGGGRFIGGKKPSIDHHPLP